MIAAVLTDILGLLAIVALCGGMLFLAYRIEPHWVSKDKRRFLTVAQELDQVGTPLGRKHEVRVHVDPEDDALLIRKRSVVRPGSNIWQVHGKAPKPPRGRAVYILKKVTADTDVGHMALRLPVRSKMIPRMEQLLAATGENAIRRRSAPESSPPVPADAPDPPADAAGTASPSE